MKTKQHSCGKSKHAAYKIPDDDLKFICRTQLAIVSLQRLHTVYSYALIIARQLPRLWWMHWGLWHRATYKEAQSKVKTAQNICSLSSQHSCWPYMYNIEKPDTQFVITYHGQWWSILRTHLLQVKQWKACSNMYYNYVLVTYCIQNNDDTYQV